MEPPEVPKPAPADISPVAFSSIFMFIILLPGTSPSLLSSLTFLKKFKLFRLFWLFFSKISLSFFVVSSLYLFCQAFGLEVFSRSSRKTLSWLLISSSEITLGSKPAVRIMFNPSFGPQLLSCQTSRSV